jgi:hypothetical protein
MQKEEPSPQQTERYAAEKSRRNIDPKHESGKSQGRDREGGHGTHDQDRSGNSPRAHAVSSVPPPNCRALTESASSKTSSDD